MTSHSRVSSWVQNSPQDKVATVGTLLYEMPSNNFWSFKIRIKSYLSKRKNLCFSSEIWGHFSFTFWRYLKSENEGKTFCRYFSSEYKGITCRQVIPSDLEGNFSIFFRQSFFPWYVLGMPSFNNSVGKWRVDCISQFFAVSLFNVSYWTKCTLVTINSSRI